MENRLANLQFCFTPQNCELHQLLQKLIWSELEIVIYTKIYTEANDLQF